MLFGNRRAKEAERTLAEVKPQLVSILNDVGSRFSDVKFRAERVLEGQLSSEDRRQLTEAVEATDANLDACRDALQAIETYQRTRDLRPSVFRDLKTRFLTDREDPDEAVFDTSHEAIQWIATRALEFAEYLRDKQIAWFERSLEEAQDAIDEASTQTTEAETRRAEAKQELLNAQAEMPHVRFIYAEQKLRQLEDRWAEFEHLQRQNVHADSAGFADELEAMAQEVLDAVREARELVADPEAKFAEARDFMDELRMRFRSSGRRLPAEAAEAEEALMEARAEAGRPQPDWSEAIRHYNRASGLAAAAVRFLPEDLQ